MHCSCIGILQYLVGNVVWELFLELGGSFRHHVAACGQIMGMAKAMAHNLGVECPIFDLTIGMFRAGPSKAPKMKLKASEGRYFLPILRAMLQICFPLTTDHALLRFRCVDALYAIYQLMNHWDAATSPNQFRHLVVRHLLLYAELSRQSVDDLLWRIYPKHHLFAHMLGSQNPKLEWCYAMESEIGKAVKVAVCACELMGLPS